MWPSPDAPDLERPADEPHGERCDYYAEIGAAITSDRCVLPAGHGGAHVYRDSAAATAVGGLTADRFWSKVARQSNGCWLWTGELRGVKPWLYGVFRIGRVKHRAHRFAWELANGAIPAGQVVCHTCDVPACVNPAHLFLGTQGDNVRDMIAKGRSGRPPVETCPRGHQLTGDNARRDPRHPNARSCRTCQRAADRARVRRIRTERRAALPTSAGRGESGR